MTHKFSQGALGFLLSLAPALGVHAQPAPDTEEAAESADAGASGDAVGRISLQLFEFLGEFTTEDGEWVDPALLMEGDIVGSAQREMGNETTREPQEQGADDEPIRLGNCVKPQCG